MNKNMEKALLFFESMGLPIKNGFIDSTKLTEEQLKLLRQWENDTSIEGIIMPTLESMYQSLLVAVSLNPQQTKEGHIRYLLGKGIGTEIALRGTIEGRIKHHTNPPYRSHSDFELYDANEPYTPFFTEVFGSQEWFPYHVTKGLHDMEEGFLDETHEVVDIEGYKFLVPQLEILFLDKYLAKESTPREEGYDCELLAREYDLDKNLIMSYLEKYYMIQERQKDERMIKVWQNTFKARTEEFLNGKNGENEGNVSLTIEQWNEALQKRQKFKMVVGFCGAPSDMWIPLTMNDIIAYENGHISLTEEYVSKMKEKIEMDQKKHIDAKLNNVREELMKLLDNASPKKTITLDSIKDVCDVQKEGTKDQLDEV